MLREISAKNVEASIRKLVSFGTRNTLSEQDNPTRGIGADRSGWVSRGASVLEQELARVEERPERVLEPGAAVGRGRDRRGERGALRARRRARQAAQVERVDGRLRGRLRRDEVEIGRASCRERV